MHPPLIAIDGLPCAGKSTLVNKLKERIPVDCIHLDSTALQAAIARGVGAWEKEWRELFLPSSDIYMRTHPEGRAELVVPGRGIA